MRGSRLTARGVGFCAAGLGTVGLASVAGQPDLVWPGVFLLLVPLVALVTIVATHPRFVVTRHLVPAVVEVGSPVRVDLSVTAPGRLGTGAARASDNPPRTVGTPHRFVLPAERPGRATRESYVRRPNRRGRWRWDPLTYECTDVLGLASRRARAPAVGQLVVTPPVLPLARGQGAAFGRHGETPIPQTAISGPDDVLVRDYQPRDDVRRVHWRSTARTGTLMVRREEQAWDPTAWLLLDSRAVVHPLQGDTSPTFEWLLTAAASIGTTLVDEGFEVSIADAAGSTFTVSASHNPGAAAQFVEHLVDAERSEEGSLVLAGRAVAQSPSGHVVVALLGRLDEETARHLVATHDTLQECRAIVLPQPSSRPAFAAGEAILVHHGWRVATCAVGGDLAGTWAAITQAPRSAR